MLGNCFTVLGSGVVVAQWLASGDSNTTYASLNLPSGFDRFSLTLLYSLRARDGGWGLEKHIGLPAFNRKQPLALLLRASVSGEGACVLFIE